MFSDTKVILYNDKVILYNYLNIVEISEGLIIIDKWKVKGKNLKISELDSYYMIITGIINGVEFV